MKIYLTKFILLFALFSASFALFAREVTIYVIDADINLPLEGAKVRTSAAGEHICDRQGKTVIEVPDNRQIIVQAVYPGYDTGIITVPVTGNTFTIRMHLASHMMGSDLEIEAAKPSAAETRTGRSIAVTAQEITQTAEIGIIEDVMSTISLLPGVSYKGFLDAEPSIRGGHPGDMSASLNGFHINNPFFWGGTFSIFDPRMVQSAQLSHGIFSVRYGHTISGLLEVISRDPSPTETQFELGVNTSAANFNLSLPLFGKGGILFMGRVTYYDPVLALAGAISDSIPESAKELSDLKSGLALVNSFDPVPHIRTVTANGNYRFFDNLVLSATGFFGMDGVGISFNNSSLVNGFLDSDTSIDFLFKNYQAFFTTSLAWNPRSDMLLKLLLGTGYEEQDNLGDINYNIREKHFSKAFQDKFPDLYFLIQDQQPYQFWDSGLIDQSESNLNLQGRFDYDWHLSKNIFLSAGVQTMYNIFKASGVQRVTRDIPYASIKDPEDRQKIEDNIKAKWPIMPEPVLNKLLENLVIAMPISYPPNPKNNLLTTSGYIMGEFTLGNRINTELGLRVDHFFLTGDDDFRLDSEPALNPRLNLEFNLFNSNGFFKKIDLSLGSGLFSSINDNVFFAEKDYNIDTMKPNRSWTSVLGFKFEFPESIHLNIEGYYKYIFDRMYIMMETSIGGYNILPKFNGEGMVWGIDVLLQKIQSRYWDGWLSYSFSWAKYRDPDGDVNASGRSGGTFGDDWYYPSFHRFHTLNLIFNYKPISSMNLYIRLGMASGVPLQKRSKDGPQSYPVYLYNDDIFIEKYYWESTYDENNRTTPSLNMDIKFSIFGGHKTGKTRYELYFAIENVLGLLYTAQGNTSFNQYTGELDDGAFSATFDIPIPIPSFGFKISY